MPNAPDAWPGVPADIYLGFVGFLWVVIWGLLFLLGLWTSSPVGQWRDRRTRSRCVRAQTYAAGAAGSVDQRSAPLPDLDYLYRKVSVILLRKTAEKVHCKVSA